MTHRRTLSLIAAATAALLIGISPTASSTQPGTGDHLDMYTTVVTTEQLRELSRLGHDVGSHQVTGSGVEVDLVLTAQQRGDLRRRGINAQLTRIKGGQPVKQFAAAQASGGFQVWRSWDEPGGIRDQIVQTAAANPQVAKLVKIGTTIQGRDILAVKLTQGAQGIADGSRPAVLYSATQHAREWIAT